MGIASLVLGIVSIIMGFVPFCGTIALVPAIVGVVLGIIVIAKKESEEVQKTQRGLAIAGLILSIIAIVVICLYWFVFSTNLQLIGGALENASKELNNINITVNTSL